MPEKQRATSSLFAYFYKLFPGQVVKANMCMDTGHIEKLMQEREKAIIKYENAVASEYLLMVESFIHTCTTCACSCVHTIESMRTHIL